MARTPLERLARDPPSVVISIPIGNTAVAASHRAVARAGARLILLDNAPTGLLPGQLTTPVSFRPDNFGLGQIAAEMLVAYCPQFGWHFALWRRLLRHPPARDRLSQVDG